MNKYHNKKVKVDKIIFDSIKESKRYLQLKQLEKEGKITNLQLQPTFELQPHYKLDNKTIRAITYKADFSYFDTNNKLIVEDVKGVETEVFKIKRKLFQFRYPNIDFRIIR